MIALGKFKNGTILSYLQICILSQILWTSFLHTWATLNSLERALLSNCYLQLGSLFPYIKQLHHTNAQLYANFLLISTRTDVIDKF